jgi:hypothetical protein
MGHCSCWPAICWPDQLGCSRATAVCTGSWQGAPKAAAGGAHLCAHGARPEPSGDSALHASLGAHLLPYDGVVGALACCAAPCAPHSCWCCVSTSSLRHCQSLFDSTFAGTACMLLQCLGRQGHVQYTIHVHCVDLQGAALHQPGASVQHAPTTHKGSAAQGTPAAGRNHHIRGSTCTNGCSWLCGVCQTQHQSNTTHQAPAGRAPRANTRWGGAMISMVASVQCRKPAGRAKGRT